MATGEWWLGRLAQQHTNKVEEATAPHHYALKTKAGHETVAHILQDEGKAENATPAAGPLWDSMALLDGESCGKTEVVRNCLSTRLSGLRRVVDGEWICGQHSTYVWANDSGEVHTIPQSEWGTRGPFVALALLPRPAPCSLRRVGPVGTRNSSRTWTM